MITVDIILRGLWSICKVKTFKEIFRTEYLTGLSKFWGRKASFLNIPFFLHYLYATDFSNVN